MKPVLILQNQATDGPAYLGSWLQNRSIPYVVYNTHELDLLTSIQPYSALAVLGGSMSANDNLISNRQTEILILQAMYRDIPVIGHCLGGQLMSRALGGYIDKSPKPEIGWQSIQWLDNPETVAWFGEGATQTVMHWHYESFSIPPGATLLASSPACPNQAFSIGKHLAMQFHIEVDQDKIKEWTIVSDPNWSAAKNTYDTVQNASEILGEINANILDHKTTAGHVYSKWLSTTSWNEHLRP